MKVVIAHLIFLMEGLLCCHRALIRTTYSWQYLSSLSRVIISQIGTQHCSEWAANFELGGYQLDQDIRGIKSEMEDMSHLLGFGSFVRMFSDEKIFKVNQIYFLDVKWDCLIGVTNKKIYKIALSGKSIESILETAMIHFSKNFGNPTESRQDNESNINIWEFPRANLVLSKQHPSNVVNIIATSGTPFKETNPNLIVPK